MAPFPFLAVFFGLAHHLHQQQSGNLSAGLELQLVVPQEVLADGTRETALRT